MLSAVRVVRPSVVTPDMFESKSPAPEPATRTRPHPLLAMCGISASRRSSDWSDDEILILAKIFIDRAELLIEAAEVPPWQDQDDIFGGEVFPEERDEFLRLEAKSRGSLEARREVLATMFCSEEGEDPLDMLGLALYYLRRLLDSGVSIESKREILKRIYTSEEPEWTLDEIVGLHFILLDECACLARELSSEQRKQEVLAWVFTDPQHDTMPFSFANCVKLFGRDKVEVGSLAARIREDLKPMLKSWLFNAKTRKGPGPRPQLSLGEL